MKKILTSLVMLAGLAAWGLVSPTLAQDEDEPDNDNRPRRGAAADDSPRRGDRDGPDAPDGEAAPDEERDGPDGEREGGDRRGPRGFGEPNMGRFMRMFPMFAVIDVDEDGEISPRELKKSMLQLRTLDANEDGKLTEDELRPQFPGGPGFGGGPGGGQGGPGGGQGGPGGQRGRGGPGFGTPEDMVKRWMGFDANQDGQLSQQELLNMAQQLMRPPQGQQQQAQGQGDGSDENNFRRRRGRPQQDEEQGPQ